MFIGICGSLCSGRKTVAQYLVDHHGFKRLHLRGESLNFGIEKSESLFEETVADKQQQRGSATSSDSLVIRGRKDSQTFDTAEELLEFVTLSWRGRFVTTDISTEKVLDVFLRRPFFMLISVDAPLRVRWRRWNADVAHLDSGVPGATNLEAFVELSDVHQYCPRRGVQPLMGRATVRLLNTSDSLAHLYATLGRLDVTNPERLRPGWDAYFMALASLAARRSNCMKRRVGCVLVGEGRRVVSTGYNGTPRGLRNCADGGCPRCNGSGGGGGGGGAGGGYCASGVGLSTCLCLHAEENALLEAGRERILLGGSVLYCDTCPCLTCSIKICQVGIGEVVYAYGYSMDREAAEVFREAGVKLRQFTPPPNGLIHLEKMELY